MADSFFEFNTSLTGLGLDDAPDLDEEEYDALNNETFGDNEFQGDWEADHTKYAEVRENSRLYPSCFNSDNDDFEDLDDDEDLDLETSLSQLVLEDCEDEEDVALPQVTAKNSKSIDPFDNFKSLSKQRFTSSSIWSTDAKKPVPSPKTAQQIPDPITPKLSAIRFLPSQIPKMPTVQELERDLMQKNKQSKSAGKEVKADNVNYVVNQGRSVIQNVNQQVPPPPSSNALPQNLMSKFTHSSGNNKMPPGFSGLQRPAFLQPPQQEMLLIRNNVNMPMMLGPGLLPPYILPNPPPLLLPQNHRLVPPPPPPPPMMRFIPPHPVLLPQQQHPSQKHQQHQTQKHQQHPPQQHQQHPPQQHQQHPPQQHQQHPPQQQPHPPQQQPHPPQQQPHPPQQLPHPPQQLPHPPQQLPHPPQQLPHPPPQLPHPQQPQLAAHHQQLRHQHQHQQSQQPNQHQQQQHHHHQQQFQQHQGTQHLYHHQQLIQPQQHPQQQQHHQLHPLPQQQFQLLFQQHHILIQNTIQPRCNQVLMDGQKNSSKCAKHMNHGHSSKNNIPDRRGAGDFDEYAGLMNIRERTWLRNIQLIQLTTDRPHMDDYYYNEWLKKQDKKAKKKTSTKNGIKKDKIILAKQSNQTDGGNRDRKDTDQDSVTAPSPRVYVPLQFENSLGKLQCVSVTAPRKIIDLDVVSEPQTEAAPVSVQRDSRKTKKLLLELERLYLLAMEIEEIDANVRVEEKVSTKPELLGKIMSSFLNETRFLSFMCIRKGKALLLRIMKHLDVNDYNEQLSDLWSRTIKSIAVIVRRDHHDGILLHECFRYLFQSVIPFISDDTGICFRASFKYGDVLSVTNQFLKLYPYFKNWITSATFSRLSVLTASLLTGNSASTVKSSSRAVSPVSGKTVLSVSLASKFGVSIIASILSRGEVIYPNLSEKDQLDWSAFIFSFMKQMTNVPTLENIPTPLEPLTPEIVTSILNRSTGLHIQDYASAKRILNCFQ